MMKIEWFKKETRELYAENIEKKISKKYAKYKSDVPQRLKFLIFEDEDGYSSEKMKKFLMMSFEEVFTEPIFKEYIDNKIRTDLRTDEADNAIKMIFNYKQLTNIKGKQYSRDGLLNSLNVAVCPYCNRQYITPFGKRSSADLDHFFPKENYPLFALSLFNFVPSCQVCNSRMKLKSFLGENGEMPLYPYNSCFGDNAVFKISDEPDAGALLSIWLGENSKDLKITLDSRLDENDEIYQQIERSKELYNIEEIYHAHRNYVSELLLKKRIYDDGEYLELLNNIFKECDLFLDEPELQAFLYGYNWKDDEDVNRPLSKLTYDILMRN